VDQKEGVTTGPGTRSQPSKTNPTKKINEKTATDNQRKILGRKQAPQGTKDKWAEKGRERPKKQSQPPPRKKHGKVTGSRQRGTSSQGTAHEAERREQKGTIKNVNTKQSHAGHEKRQQRQRPRHKKNPQSIQKEEAGPHQTRNEKGKILI